MGMDELTMFKNHPTEPIANAHQHRHGELSHYLSLSDQLITVLTSSWENDATIQPSHSFPAASDVLSSTPVSLRGMGDRLEHDPRAHEKHRLMVGFRATLPQKCGSSDKTNVLQTFR